MKKRLSIFLAVALVLTVIILGGCKNNGANEPQKQENGLKFGVGSFSSMTAADAEDSEMQGEIGLTTTVAAVLLDENNKIINLKLDSIDNSVSFDTQGQISAPSEPVSKYNLGFDYMMSVYGIYSDRNGDGKVLEWFQQADAFCDVAKGKTFDELKSLIAENGYASGELATAGCTINSYDFINAVEKAVDSATDTSAEADNKINIGFSSSASVLSATADENGKVTVMFTFSAATVNNENKVTDAFVDVAECEAQIDNRGTATAMGTKIATKKEKGDNYSMSQYGQDLNGDGIVLEWYKQAEVFENACVGKTAEEISSLAVNGYGTTEIQTAGCTIAVADFTTATVNALK